MTDRMTLDAFEAKNGTDRPSQAIVEAALRDLTAKNGNVPAGEEARRVVMALDSFYRAEARSKLYSFAASIVRAAFDGEARSKLVPDKSVGCFPEDRGGWRHCTRKARSRLVLPDGAKRSACFQHEDTIVRQYVDQKYREVFPKGDGEDEGGDRMIGYSERHEGREARPGEIERDFRVVTVAMLWKRLAIRLNKALDTLPGGTSYRDTFDAQVAEFESKWGKV